jgi:hypothetical protein
MRADQPADHISGSMRVTQHPFQPFRTRLVTSLKQPWMDMTSGRYLADSAMIT